MQPEPGSEAPGADSKLLKLLDAEARQSLLDGSRRMRVEAGAQICQEGQEGSDLFVILDGKVRVVVDDFGSERVLARLERGDFFGEMALLTDDKRNATVIAEESVELLCVPREILMPVLEKAPAVKTALSKVAMKRAEELVQG